VSSTDPVAAIPEAEATGDVARLFVDIRASLGVPVVNLIWRHLATIPGALPWAWASLKPLYENNAIAGEAIALREALAGPRGDVLGRDALGAANLAADDIQRITMIVTSYERSNAMNLIALGALLSSLDGQDLSLGTAPRYSSAVEAPITGEMPRLMTADEMAPEALRLIGELNRMGGRELILPTMYRHLAYWPAFLSLIRDVIAPAWEGGDLETLIQRVAADSRRRGAPLAAEVATPDGPLNATSQRAMRDALFQFLDGPLSKMTAIVSLLRSQM
jgi:hypothetical protein